MGYSAGKENYCANCTYVFQSDSMSPTDNNSNPNNLRRVVKKGESPGIPFHLSIVPAETCRRVHALKTVHYKCWRN